ncbi:MAG: hypothetical protein HZA46_15270 [Planctomycetales bacterium]|nr:hypothetical protein [Planctomycetales bacterium]
MRELRHAVRQREHLIQLLIGDAAGRPRSFFADAPTNPFSNKQHLKLQQAAHFRQSHFQVSFQRTRRSECFVDERVNALSVEKLAKLFKCL